MQTLYSSESELLFSDQVVLRTKAKTLRCWTTTILVSSTCCLIWAERSAHNSLLFHVEGQKASLVPGLYHCHSIHLILHCLCDCHTSKTLTITWLVVTRLQNLNKRWENEPNLHLICDLVKCFPVSWRLICSLKLCWMKHEVHFPSADDGGEFALWGSFPHFFCFTRAL